MDDTTRGKDKIILFFFNVRIGHATHLTSYSVTANSFLPGVQRSGNDVENSSPLGSMSRMTGA